MPRKKKVKKPKDAPLANVAGNVKVVPCDSRNYLEVVDGCYVWIPLTDEEKKVFVPNWSEATGPAWEIFLTDYTRVAQKDDEPDTA